MSTNHLPCKFQEEKKAKIKIRNNMSKPSPTNNGIKVNSYFLPSQVKIRLQVMLTKLIIELNEVKFILKYTTII